MKKTLAFRFISDTIMVLREDAGTPSDEDWDAFLRELASRRDEFDRLRILVYTDGGGPNQMQRSRLAKALGGRRVRVAVVTERSVVRFIVSSIALLNSLIKSFTPNELPGAFTHLSFTPAEEKLVQRALEEMHPLITDQPARNAAGG